jgi:transglutaminase-like putative cysteine protease
MFPQTRKAFAVYEWVKKNFEFSPDEERARFLPVEKPGDIVEILVRPLDVSLLLRGGQRNQEDCDGYSTYIAALLTALGVKCSFVTVAANPDYPGVFSHVYVAAYCDGDRVALDASHGKFFGWEAPADRVSRKREWPVDEGCGWVAWFAMAVGAGFLANLAYREFAGA